MDPVQIGQIITVVAGAIKTAVDLGPIVIKGVEDAKPFAQVIVSTILGREITVDELSGLEQQLATLSAQFQQPLPPEQADDV